MKPLKAAFMLAALFAFVAAAQSSTQTFAQWRGSGYSRMRAVSRIGYASFVLCPMASPRKKRCAWQRVRHSRLSHQKSVCCITGSPA